MDVADTYATQSQVKDEVGVRCQKLFQDFLEEYVYFFVIMLYSIYSKHNFTYFLCLEQRIGYNNQFFVTQIQRR